MFSTFSAAGLWSAAKSTAASAVKSAATKRREAPGRSGPRQRGPVQFPARPSLPTVSGRPTGRSFPLPPAAFTRGTFLRAAADFVG